MRGIIQSIETLCLEMKCAFILSMFHVPGILLVMYCIRYVRLFHCNTMPLSEYFTKQDLMSTISLQTKRPD